MKPASTFKVSLLFALVFSGCESTIPDPTAPASVDFAPMKTATEKVEAAAAKVEVAARAAEAERTKAGSKAAAAVTAASSANERNPEGPPKVAVAGELVEASKWLPPPTGEDAAEAMRRVNLILTGQRDEARAAYAAADEDRIASRQRAAEADTLREAAMREVSEAKQAARDTVAKTQAEADARVTAYKIESETRIREADSKAARVIDEANASAVRLIFFPIAGVFALAGFVMALLAWSRDSAHLWEMAGVCLGISLLACAIPFGLALPWFPWLAGFIVIGLFALGVWVVVRANRAKRDADTDAADNAAASATLAELSRGIDLVKDAAPAAAAAILPTLSSVMSASSKSLVNRLRAARIDAISQTNA